MKQAYHEGAALRKRFVWRGGMPDTPEGTAAVDAENWSEAAKWAADTWEMLHEHHPGPDDRRFFGDPENLSMGVTGLRLNVSAERATEIAVDAFMGAKLALLSAMLGEKSE